MIPKNILALGVVAALTACGGGGDNDSGSSATGNTGLLSLTGIDYLATLSVVDSCKGISTNKVFLQGTLSGNIITLTVMDTKSVPQYVFNLNQISGNDQIGFDFTGDVTDPFGVAQGVVNSAQLRNMFQPNYGKVDYFGVINVSNNTCTIKINVGT